MRKFETEKTLLKEVSFLIFPNILYGKICVRKFIKFFLFYKEEALTEESTVSRMGNSLLYQGYERKLEKR